MRWMSVSVLLVTVGCGSDPLKSGTYTITRASFTNDTCGFVDADVGIGEAWTAELSWDDDDIVIEGFQADASYTREGEVWVAASDATGGDDVCTTTFEEAHELAVIDTSTFQIDATRRLGTRGSCADLDSPAPCGYDLVYSGIRD
jgi:hypothetical protein